MVHKCNISKTNARYIDSVYAYVFRFTYALDNIGMGMDNGKRAIEREREHKLSHPCDRKNFSHTYMPKKIADTYTLHIIIWWANQQTNVAAIIECDTIYRGREWPKAK